MGGEAVEAPRTDDGADQGVDIGAPKRPETVRHLAEDDARAQRLLGGVVGRRHGAVREEGKELGAPAFGLAQHLSAGLGNGRKRRLWAALREQWAAC